MNQSTTTDNSPLQLYPPKIQGQTEPVKGAHVGVPLVAYDLVSDGEGAKVQIDPPLVGIWESEDVVKLWLVNDTTLLSFTTIGDPNVPIFLRIPRNRLHPDEVNQLYYTVERNSNNTGTSEPPLQVLYNRIRPGLKDRFPEIDGHSELELDLSDLIKQGVGKDFVSAPVCFSYPYCRAYDTISLKCNGEIETFPVSKDQAPEPPNPGTEVPTTVCFTVEREFLDKAKRQNKVLNFSYTVTDQLLNGPDPDAVWSAAVAVNEDLDGSLLDKPILLERKEDYPGDDAETIDLEKLAGNPLLLVVMTKDNRFEVGDEIVATYTATGQTDPVVVRGKVEEDPFLGKLPCFLEVPNNKVFAGSKVTAIYELHRPNVGLVGSSNTATATVVGSRIVLKPAKIKEAPNDTSLDPLNAQNALTAVIDYDGMLVGDKIIVKWTGASGTLPGGSHTTDPWPVTTVGSQEIPLAVPVIAFNLDKSITLDYSVTHGTQEPKDSETRTLAVLPIAQSHLPKPLIVQASEAGEGSDLDVSQLTTNATLRANSYPHIALRQYVWLKAKGTLKGGGVYSKTFWQPPNSQTNATWINQGFYTHVFPLADLQSLEDGSDIILEFKSGFGGTQVESEAVTFALRTYKIKAPVELIVDLTPVDLPGPNIVLLNPDHFPWTLSGRDPEGTANTRTPSSGTEPYKYFSSDVNVAIVDDSGTVRSAGNGNTRITVIDANGGEASYPVTCANVAIVIRSEQTYASGSTPDRDAYKNWVTSLSGSYINQMQILPGETWLNIINLKYIPRASFDTLIVNPHGPNYPTSFTFIRTVVGTETFETWTGHGSVKYFAICAVMSRPHSI